MATSDTSENVENILLLAVEVWKHEQLVNLTPTWKQQPQGHFLAEELAKRRGCETGLVKLLAHENELVVAYSLVALEMMDSASLGQLPTELLERKQLLTKLRGSFAVEFELGEFAKEIQNQWRENHSPK